MQLLFEYTAKAFLVLDRASIAQLMIVAFVLRFACLNLPAVGSLTVSVVTATLAFVVYSAYRIRSDGDDVGALVISLVRGGLMYCIVLSMMIPTASIASVVLHRLRRALLKAKLCWLRFRVWRLKRQLARLPKFDIAPPRTPTRRERLQLMATEARADYDAEITAITDFPLDEDERDVLLGRARQRLLEKLQGFTET
jgi:hypothetical protein